MGAACRGDVSIITHMWTDKNSQPIVNQTAPHQCVDFEKVMQYSKEQTVDVYQDNYIVHPKFGKSAKACPGRCRLTPTVSQGRLSPTDTASSPSRSREWVTTTD